MFQQILNVKRLPQSAVTHLCSEICKQHVPFRLLYNRPGFPELPHVRTNLVTANLGIYGARFSQRRCLSCWLTNIYSKDNAGSVPLNKIHHNRRSIRVTIQSLKKIAILRGAIFVQISPFRTKSQFFANFALARNFLRKFVTLRSAIFRKVCKFCNLREDTYVFPLKFAFFVLGWCAINFCANWAKIGLLC